jgi:hypothetical protein
MITGILMFTIGVAAGVTGALRFDKEVMMFGWGLAAAGVVVFAFSIFGPVP